MDFFAAAFLLAVFLAVSFFETDFFDVTLYAAIEGHYLPTHLRIVGKFYIAKVNELAADPQCCDSDYCDGDDIRKYLFATVFHIFPVVNKSL